jgi:hypothetical protein
MLKRTAVVTILVVVLALAAVTLRQAVQAQGGGGQLTTQDYIDIQQLYARYTHALDGGDGKAWGETFTVDGQIWSDTALAKYPNYTLNGRSEIAGYVKGPARERPRVGHVNTNIVITPTATGAIGRSYLLLHNLESNPPRVTGGGIYEDVLVKTAEGWRFKKRSHHGAIQQPAAKPSN